MRISKTKDVKTPVRAHSTDAGIDFFVPNSIPEIVLMPGEAALIPSGIRADVPKGFMLTAFNKSGVATKWGLIIGACVVDESYQGEIHLHLINTGFGATTILPGDKIAQFILIPVNYESVEVVSERELFPEASKRGEGGFGSSGEQ